MSLFRICIFDKHEVQDFEGGEIIIDSHPQDKDWHKFDLYIETTYIKIDSFREYVLLDKDLTPCVCTKVFLSDGSFVLACVSPETFAKYYEEKYLPTIIRQNET